MAEVDLAAPLKLPRDVFDSFIAEVDRLVATHDVALELTEDVPYRVLRFVGEQTYDLAGLGGEQSSRMLDSLDQMTLFAFEAAPDDVIQKWGEREARLGEEARARVRQMRETMVALAGLWSEKSNSVTPPLVGVRYEPIRESDGTIASWILYLSAARISLNGTPDRSDASKVRLQLWPADVQMLIDELQHMLSGHVER